jgi:hypothetical protein
MQPFVIAAAAALVPQVTDLTDLESVFSPGYIFAVGVSDDQSRAYVGEGAGVTVLDLGAILPSGVPPTAPPFPHPSVIAKVPVDASIQALMRHDIPGDPAVFIAGGSQGLLKMRADESGVCTPCSLGTTPGCFHVTTIDDQDRNLAPGTDNEMWCFDVGLAQVGNSKYVVALFAGAENTTSGVVSELRVYRRSTLGLVRVVQLPTGVSGAKAYALAADGPKVYVAMGTGGVWVADLTLITTTGVTWTAGPIFDPANPPAGCPVPTLGMTPPENGRVRDVAIDGGHLFAAADAWGLIDIHPTTLAVNACLTLANPSVPTDRSYAVRVDAVTVAGTQFVVAGGRNGSTLGEEAAPYSHLGRMTYDLGPGGEIGSAVPGIDGMYVYRRSGSLALDHFEAGDTGGELRVRVAPNGTHLRIYEQPHFLGAAILNGYPAGLKVYDHAVGSTPPAYATSPVFGYVGRGDGTFGAFRSLNQPSFVIPIEEGNPGAIASDYIDLSNPSCPSELSPSAPLFTPAGVFTPDAHWTDVVDPTKEWFLTSYDEGWVLNSLQSGAPCQVTQWLLESPRDPSCVNGRVYYLASQYLDTAANKRRILGTRGTSRWGGVLYDRPALIAASQVTAPGCALFPGTSCQDGENCPGPYVAQIDTHPELANWHAGGQHTSSVRPTYTWESEVVTMSLDGSAHQIAVIAAGFNADNTDEFINATGVPGQDGIADDPDYSRAALVLVDLNATPTGVPACATSCSGQQVPTIPPLAVAYGPDLKGNAIAVEVASVCERTFAFVADFGGRVLVFEITDPTVPTFLTKWDLPANVLDGHYDNAVDLTLQLDQVPEGGENYLYVSAFRPGLIRLQVKFNCSTYPYVFLPSPGWQSVGVKKVDTPGLAHLIEAREVNGLLGLILGDKLAGTRFYGDFPVGTTPSCP